MTPADLPPQGQPMDGLSHPVSEPVAVPQPIQAPAEIPVQPSAPPDASVRKMLSLLKTIAAAIYLAFVAWEGFLLVTLPSPTGEMRELQSLGSMISWSALLVFFAVGWFMLSRVVHSKVSVAVRQRSLIVVIVILLPGVLLAAATPFLTGREPPLGIEVVSPTKSTDFVAPVSVTYSVEKSVAILKNLGYRAAKYQWDGNGDGKVDQETVVPTFTASYPKQGAYVVTVSISIDGSSARRLQKRIVIPVAVFSVIPADPVIEKPARFSVASLLTDPKLLKQVTWDFGDGTKPEAGKTPEITHTYFAIGEYAVSATLLLTSNSEQTYKRTIVVHEPEPLPFPITMTSEPRNTMGPIPFGALFMLNTLEPLREIEWDFGDGKTERGTDLIRIGHTFDSVGIYPVVARARSLSGSLAELTQIVRVTEELQLPDLRFEGAPQVQAFKVQGEVPLEVTLTPKTAVPLVTFFWESNDPEAEITDSTFHAIFREENTYTATLVAQDADGKVFRQPVTILVKPPSAEPSISAQPDNGVAPLSVQFDASDSFIPPTETLAGFKWTFGDEDRSGDAELASSRVQHTYKIPGEYKVILKMVTISGKEFTALRTIVVRRPALNSCINSSRTKVQAGKGVEFDSNCSTGTPLTYVWDVKSDANPKVTLAQGPSAKYVYVFTIPGTYTVTLTLTDQWGNQSASSVSITVTP